MSIISDMIQESSCDPNRNLFCKPWKENLLFLPTAIVSSIIFGLPSLLYPFGRDQGAYASIAWRWLAGDVLYRDVSAFKPPGTPIIHALSQLLFGNSMFSLRYFDICWTIVTATVIALLMQIIFKRRFASLIAAVLYPFFYYQFDFWNTAQTDGWILLPTLLSLLLLTVITNPSATFHKKKIYCFIAGLPLAAAVIIKYTAFVFVIPLGVLFVSIFFQNPRHTIRLWLWLLLGFAAGIFVVFIWLYFSGAWGAFCEIQFKTMPNYVQMSESNGIVSKLQTTILIMFSYPLYLPIIISTIAGSIVGIAMLYKTREDLQAYCVCWGLLISSLASCAFQSKFFPYHFLPFAASGAMLGGIGLYCILNWLYLRSRYLKIVPVTLFVLIFLMPWTNYHAYLKETFPVFMKKKPVESFWALCGWDTYSTNQNMFLVKYLNSIKDKNDTLYVWGWEPMVNYLTQMRNPSRIGTNGFMRNPWTRDLYRNEVMAAVNKEPPTFFVVSSKDHIGWMSGSKDSLALLDDMAEMKKFLKTNYDFEKEIGRFFLFRLKNNGK